MPPSFNEKRNLQILEKTRRELYFRYKCEGLLNLAKNPLNLIVEGFFY